MAGITICAMVFGIEPERQEQAIVTSILSSLVMLPAGIIFPLIFRAINNLKSNSLKIAKKKKKAMKLTRQKTIKMRKKSLKKQRSLLKQRSKLGLSTQSIQVGAEGFGTDLWSPVDTRHSMNGGIVSLAGLAKKPSLASFASPFGASAKSKYEYVTTASLCWLDAS